MNVDNVDKTRVGGIKKGWGSIDRGVAGVGEKRRERERAYNIVTWYIGGW